MSVAEQHRFLLRLLFDQDLRADFFDDRARVLAENDLVGDDAAAFLSVDRHGLELDADARRRYLMSALCRAYPLSTCAIAAMQGAEPLSAFLASPSLLWEPNARTVSFGEHLRRLVSLARWGEPPVVAQLVQAILAFERAAVDLATGVRAAIRRNETIPEPTGADPNALASGKVVLPPFLSVLELPVPPAVVRTALGQPGPEDAWLRIESARFDPARLVSVARADPMPVTIVLRALPAGRIVEGGVAPLVDVRHLVAELPGRRTATLKTLDRTKRLAALPEADRRVVKQLVEARLLDLTRD